MMDISKEKCISDGKLGLQNVFEFVRKNAEFMQAYEMEKNIFRLNPNNSLVSNAILFC